MQPVLSLENLSKYYTSTGNVVVGLSNVTLRFRRGEFVAITGESGSGKSTLSNVIGGILGYESGEMLLEGKPTSHYDSSDWERYRRDHISYISQDYGILPGATVMSNMVSALRLAGVEKAAAKAQAQKILEQMELWDLRNRRASKLSSGQKQRLSIGRALAKPSPVLIADEPTGNLDPENSAKVISLLKQAAKSRLVLLVTHEFEEVKDHVTRHIRLQDGCVVVDAVLRPANEPEPIPQLPMQQNKNMSLFVSGLQLRSRPVWTSLMVLLFTLTAFAVVAFMGTFIVSLDDTNTKLYDPSAFVNGSPRRIVISRMDLQPMTQSDYEAIMAVEYAVRLERNGYVADAQYAYRDGVDYSTIRKPVIEEIGENLHHSVLISYKVHDNAPYIQTVPVLPQGQTFLKEGRLPENFYEVVAHTSDGFRVGDEVRVFLINKRYWTNAAQLEFTFEVVGLTDHGSGLYFSDDLGRYFQHVALTYGNAQYYQFIPEKLPVEEFDWQGIPLEYRPEDFSVELKDGEVRVHSSLWTSMNKNPNIQLVPAVQVPNVNLKREGKDPLSLMNLVKLTTPMEYGVKYRHPMDGAELTKIVSIDKTHSNQYFNNLLFVSQNTFDALCWNEVSEQVSLTIVDYAYTQRVLDALQEQGYLAISPYRLGSVTAVEEKVEQRKQTLTICLVALLAVVVLQVVALRALFAVQLSSYRLLRNIGLVRKTAKKTIMWQFLLFTLLGQLLTAAALAVCWQKNIPQVVSVLRHMLPLYFAGLSALHLSAALAAALWTIAALQKQIYPIADRFVDLQLDEEVAL